MERIISTLLEKDLPARYQTAARLRADLQQLKRDLDSGRGSGYQRGASRKVGRGAVL